MTIEHHPDDATLMSFAAGSLAEAHAAVVAAHISMCPVCRREVRLMQTIGAGLLNDLTPSRPLRGLPKVDAVMSGGDARLTRARRPATAEVPDVIAPLAGARLDQIAWKRLGPGVWHYPLPLSQPDKSDLRLLKVAPGREIPEHGHGGAELTLLLDGAYCDESGRYVRGDLADHDEDVEHQPVADPELGCVCLIATERKARFKSLVARALQPLTGL